MSLLDVLKLADTSDIQTPKDILKKKYDITELPKQNIRRCSGARLSGSGCTACIDVCPRKLYSTDRKQSPDMSSCLKCGLCAASCPDRCITVPSAMAEKFLREKGRGGVMHIHCGKSDLTVGLKLDCLADLSWEQAAYAALDCGICLDADPCAECDRAACKTQVASLLAHLKTFLGDTVYSKTVSFSHSANHPDDAFSGRELSRRELFLAFRELPSDAVFHSLPGMAKTADNGLFWRQLLRDKIQQIKASDTSGEPARYHVTLPAFTDQCYNCGSCAVQCPQQALKIEKKEDSLLVTIEVWRCVGCGICAGACKVKGISGIKTMRVTSLGKTALKKIQVYPCKRCGKPRPADAEDGLCQACRSALATHTVWGKSDTKKQTDK